MAAITVKSTYSLDLETARKLDRLAEAWGVSKSEVVRRAIHRMSTDAGPRPMSRLEAFKALRKSLALTKADADKWIREADALKQGWGPRVGSRKHVRS